MLALRPALRAALACLGVAIAPQAVNAEPPATQDERFVIEYEKYTLENGLEVILHHDPSLPKVAVNIWYHVGPVNEPAGRSGFAHLFEHLMFEGSKHAGRQFDQLLESVGVTNSNGTTNWDRTNYFETVPSEHLELVLWLESDRMGFMIDALTPERLEAQRQVVKNERRQSYENAPYGPSELALYDALYPPGHPYHGAVIGSMEDLDRATLDDARQFFDQYYAPSNATLTIAGAFDPTHAKALIEKYFAGLRKRPKPRASPPPLAPIAGEITLQVEEPVDLARVNMSWLTPPAYSPSARALDIATSVLALGKASRLYQQLVVDKKLATSVNAYIDENQLVSEVRIDVLVATNHTPQEVILAVDQTLAELAKSGPTEPELARAKRGAEVPLLSSLQLLNGHGGESGRAGTLQRLNHYLDDPGALPKVLAELQRVNAEHVQNAVNEHLKKDRRVVVVTVPEKAKEQ